MQRVHRASFVVPHDPYRIGKRFRHEEDLGYESVKWHKNIYNKDMGEIFGSTPIRWLTRIIYYLCFYLGVCILWIICWVVFQVTLSESEPNNYMTEAPGMAFAPHLGHLTFPSIVFRERKDLDIDPYTREIDHFLSKYGELNEDFGNCTADNEYGYMQSKPCVFLKINRVINFQPETYDNAAELPKNAPTELQILLKELKPEERRNRVWLSCSADRKGITKIEYYPKIQSVAAELLTVKKKQDYTPSDYKRIVAVQISGFNINEKFNVKCFTWAKNIPQLRDGYGNRGFMQFSLHVKKGLLFTYD